MKLVASNTFLYSFTWDAATDNGAIGSYDTPIVLKKGDIIQNSAMYAITGLTEAGASIDVLDAGGNSLTGANFPLTSLNTTNNCVVFLFSSIIGVVTAGYMKIKFSGANVTAGSFRIDIEVYRQY